MVAKVLVCTIIGPNKQYCSGFLTTALQRLSLADSTNGYYTVLDGAGWMPDSMPGLVHDLGDSGSGPGLYGRVGRLREAARVHFLAGDWTHLYFHDADTLAPTGVIEALLAHDAAMAAALYNMRQVTSFALPTLPVVPRSLLKNGAVPFTVDCYGMGAMLLRRDVLEAVRFRTVEFEPGEDWLFCQDAIAAGFAPVVVDPALSCWHIRSEGTGNRPIVGSMSPGAIWTDTPHFVSNRFGLWEAGVPRHDLTPDQTACLGPGFTLDNFARLSVEIQPFASILQGGL